MVAVIDEKIVRDHTLIILSPCHQGNRYILTLHKYYLQYKQKYDRLNRFGRLFVKAGSLPFPFGVFCIFFCIRLFVFARTGKPHTNLSPQNP